MSDVNEEDEITQKKWMVRPCFIYKDEYRDCTSFRARFNQYFVFGATDDCSQWKRDYNNCVEWGCKKDMKAFNELVDSETGRRAKRLGAHYRNNVWERRTSPPKNWNAPLPDHLEKAHNASYLTAMANQSREELDVPLRKTESFCAIS